MIRTESLLRALTAGLMTYIFSLGATFNGVVLPQVQQLTLLLLVLLSGIWLLLRRGSVWHRTPLDAALFVWATAFAISLAANLENWRRIVIALWFVGLYMGVWYAAADLFLNNHLRRAALVDGFLVSSVIIVGFGYFQLINAGPVSSGLFGLARPVSLLGNPNALASYLIVAVAFALGRVLALRQTLLRVLLTLLGLAAALLLFLTFSRGAWLGMGAALVVAAALILVERDLLAPAKLRAWLLQRSIVTRMGIAAGMVVALVGVILVGVILLESLNERGRTVDHRTSLWIPAVDMFMEKPLTGYGLYTYGIALEQHQSQPPLQPHSHAHNVVLQVAGELGIMGLAALGLTLVLAGRAFRANWRDASERERGLLMAGAAGAVGFGIHHLLDIPAMMPAVALTGLLALMVAALPVKPVEMQSAIRRTGHGLAMAGLWVVLLASGLWSAGIYRQYIALVSQAEPDADFTALAQSLQPVIDADPALPVYRLQQAFFYGLAADRGAAPEPAIAAYRAVLAQLPYNASAWTNYGALLWQSGDSDTALMALRRAAALAPESWQIVLLWAQTAEAVGETEESLRAYTGLASIYGAVLHPALAQSAVGRDVALTADLEGLPEVVRQILAGDMDSALTAWQMATDQGTDPQLMRPAGYVVRAIIAQAQGEDPSAWLNRAEAVASPGVLVDENWLLYGQGQAAGEDPEIVWQALSPDLFMTDYQFSVNVPRAQFLREIIPQIFLPQTGYTPADPMLLALVAAGMDDR